MQITGDIKSKELELSLNLRPTITISCEIIHHTL